MAREAFARGENSGFSHQRSFALARFGPCKPFCCVDGYVQLFLTVLCSDDAS